MAAFLLKTHFGSSTARHDVSEKNCIAEESIMKRVNSFGEFHC
jgi:hypothetical protein